MKKNLLGIVTIAIMIIAGCAMFKKVARTANDIAEDLCQITAAEYTVKARDGLSVEEWCGIQEHLDPFIEYVLSAKMSNMGLGTK